MISSVCLSIYCCCYCLFSFIFYFLIFVVVFVVIIVVAQCVSLVGSERRVDNVEFMCSNPRHTVPNVVMDTTPENVPLRKG